ncbi:sulfotransferase ssu-1 [Rhipicephalus sanguineus]|uniref:sulfotransferase ssu-1 n=1 Tax=Rhipicephalus sanguineus TaxID=34632 RepID=UPI001894DC9D|nr:sulfotransferase ssu-1 [Rhipicephalus sanguineus]
MAMRPLTRMIEGMPWSHYFPEQCVRSALAYQPLPGDVFIVSYPKCGTTWLQYIVYNIYSGGDPTQNMEQFRCSIPFLERGGAERSVLKGRPGAIRTHLPFDKQLYSPQARYLYITRNPFDCCVSYYYHTKHFPAYCFEQGTFDDFFELFLTGDVEFGDYFDHLLPWYAHRSDPNVLFLTYEELKGDTAAVVVKIAGFLGDEYAARLRREPMLLGRILEVAALKNMKKAFNCRTFPITKETATPPTTNHGIGVEAETSTTQFVVLTHLVKCEEWDPLPLPFLGLRVPTSGAADRRKDARSKPTCVSTTEAKLWLANDQKAECAKAQDFPAGTSLEELLQRPMTGEFVRKGAVGDWKGHFSPVQVQRMLGRIKVKTAGSDVMDLWKEFDIPR